MVVRIVFINEDFFILYFLIIKSVFDFFICFVFFVKLFIDVSIFFFFVKKENSIKCILVIYYI